MTATFLPAELSERGSGLNAPRRLLRTVLQVAVAVAAAIPAAVALLPIPADVAAWAVGIGGVVVLVVTAVQNAVEQVTGKTLLEPKPPAELVEPLEVAPVAPVAPTPLPARKKGKPSPNARKR